MNALVEGLYRSRKMIVDYSGMTIKAAGGNIFYTDLVVNGAANRSLALIDGFIALHGSRNFLCIAPIVRMHLDTLLRLHALRIVDDVEAVARLMFENGKLKDVRDAKGKKLTDKYIREDFVSYWTAQERDVSWVDPVYETTSGHIHLSAAHILSVTKFGAVEGEMIARIAGGICDDEQYPSLAEDAAGAMSEISGGICTYLELWARTKQRWAEITSSNSAKSLV